jgi:antirestriction protein ArdC
METQTANSNKKKQYTGDVYEIVTQKIIEQLDKGIIPWRVPWAKAGVPKNYVTSRPYRGINAILLGSLGYEQNYFITSAQLKDIDGAIKAEEKPHVIVYWSKPNKENGATETDAERKKQSALRYYTVFNIAQCAGNKIETKSDTAGRPQPIAVCEALVKGMPHQPEIRFKEQAPFYNCLSDFINMPKAKTFDNEEAYYETLFHQLVHATGHHTRLDRIGIAQMSEFGYNNQSFEDLIAEIATGFLISYTGITVSDVGKEYLKNWSARLRGDKYLAINAAMQAQKAIDYILGVAPEEKDNGEE